MPIWEGGELSGGDDSQLDLAYAYAVSGQRQKARRVLSRVHREPGRAWPPSIFFASVYAALERLRWRSPGSNAAMMHMKTTSR